MHDLQMHDFSIQIYIYIYIYIYIDKLDDAVN